MSPLPDVVVFDLDNTLAESKQPVTEGMAEALAALLAHTHVAIISGGKLEQLTTQVADLLPPGADRARLLLLPTSGAALAAYQDGTWKVLQEERIPPDAAREVMETLESVAHATGCIDFTTPSYGPRIEYRGAQISLSALGQEAPIEAKERWDPDRVKRQALEAALTPALPDYDVKSGGLTTIDVTAKGVNKASGVRTLATHLGIPLTRMLYIGDALYPGGNDEVVTQTGIATRPVANPHETLQVIRDLIAREL